MFTHEQIIAELLKKEQGGSAPKFFTSSTGWEDGKPPSYLSGSYQGKAGSMRRSNKGRSRRMPNGTRRYIVDYNSDVIAYKP